MIAIKRFNPDFRMHAVRFEAFAREAEHGELVQFGDHQQTVTSLEAKRDALAVCCSLYREAISKARRLINVDEMGDADDVLAQAERELSSHDAALAAIQTQVVDKFADDLHKAAMALCSVKPDNTAPGAYAWLARSFAKKLR
ncbi:hypothetical protein [Serratia ureilytica]|uniref:hypothetical protein n=1 Tax=Serratia ureilytica TaxID=300181 RepID=UPI0038516B9F